MTRIDKDVEGVMLSGLHGLEYNKCKEYYDLVDLDTIKTFEIRDQLIYPVIRNIITRIIRSADPENKDGRWPEIIYSIASGQGGVTYKKLLELINVNDIIHQFEIFENEFQPVAEKYFKVLDSHAEMVLLFCSDYIFQLINKIVKK